MESVRQMRRIPKSKRELLTLGGKGDYVIEDNELRNLVRILMISRNPTTMRKTIHSLFTNRELADVIRRIMIAKYLTNGMSYDEIRKKAQASKMTISLVRKMLKWNPGLVKMLNPRVKFRPTIKEEIVNRLKRGK